MEFNLRVVHSRTVGARQGTWSEKNLTLLGTIHLFDLVQLILDNRCGRQEDGRGGEHPQGRAAERIDALGKT